MNGQSPANNLRDAFRQALEFRFACKQFDERRVLPRGDLDYVLEAGRLSPSSLGLEPWRFLVIEDLALRRLLRSACWNQVQVTSASALVVVLALKNELALDSAYPRAMLRRLVASEGELEEAMEIYRDIARGDLVGWSVAQCHIALAEMMMAAAIIGVDSCPMGGFEPEAVAEVLRIDRKRFEIAVMLAIGYRAQPQPAKQRLPLAELVEYRGSAR
jgi:nitroreductase